MHRLGLGGEEAYKPPRLTTARLESGHRGLRDGTVEGTTAAGHQRVPAGNDGLAEVPDESRAALRRDGHVVEGSDHDDAKSAPIMRRSWVSPRTGAVAGVQRTSQSFHSARIALQGSSIFGAHPFAGQHQREPVRPTLTVNASRAVRSRSTTSQTRALHFAVALFTSLPAALR